MADQNGAEPDGPTELEQKIIKQTEFYFGDMNLPKDKFLQEQIKQDDGWVPLETMTKFNRLAQLSSDISVLAAALRKSTNELLEVHEDGEKIRRSAEKPLPELNKERREDLRLRSVYAKGFPQDSSLDDLMAFFEKTGKTEHIFMRRTRERDFKGSCFVVYEKQESAKQFLDGEETAKYKDEELVKSYKDDYYKRKADEKKQLKLEDIQKKQDEKEKRQQKQDEEKKQSLADRITKGAVLHMKDIPDETTREEVKASCEPFGTVAWVEFDRGDTEAKLRFQGENSAVEAFDKIKEASDGKVKIKESDVECRVVDGEEELEYWRNVFQQQKDRHKKPGGRHGGRGGWGGRGRGSKRKFGGRNDGPSAPKVARGDD